MWRVGQHDETRFRKTCQQIVANENLWKFFKRQGHYNAVIGWDTIEHAQTLLPVIKADQEVWANMGAFQLNDDIGMDFVSKYLVVNEKKTSPNVIRNAHSVALLHQNFGDLNGKTVLEIGQGWGGLTSCLKMQWPQADVAIQDLPESAALAEKYLKELGITDVLVNPLDITPNILIAEYSLSEQDDPAIEEYWNQFKQVDGFLFRWNTFDAGRDERWFAKFREAFDVSVNVEHPQRHLNFVVIGKRK